MLENAYSRPQYRIVVGFDPENWAQYWRDPQKAYPCAETLLSLMGNVVIMTYFPVIGQPIADILRFNGFQMVAVRHLGFWNSRL